MDEIAVLKLLTENPHATQKMMAETIGKSLRTVKTITTALQEKGLLVRRNGKRNGVWVVRK